MGHLKGRLAADADFLDASPLHPLHAQFGIAQLEGRPNLRGGAQLVQDIAADRVVVIRGDVEFQEFVDVVHADPAVEDHFIGRNELNLVLFADVVLVLDRPDDLFENVFDRDRTGGATVLVHDDRHMHAILAQVAKHVLDLVRFGCEVGLAGDLSERLLLAADHGAQQVLGVEHADDVIQVALVDGDPGMAMLGHEIDGFLDRLVDFDRHQVGARDHDLANPHVAHFEDAMDHLALFFFEDTLFFADGDQHLEFFFGDERASYLRLGTHHAKNEPGHRGENEHERSHHERRQGDQPRHTQRDFFGALKGQGLGCDLARNQYDQRQHQADQPLGHSLAIEMQGEQGGGG